jgi:hypothetical protein
MLKLFCFVFEEKSGAHAIFILQTAKTTGRFQFPDKIKLPCS